MKIQIENLGTIKKGEIALDKNLIIFVGPNHSGKSYLTYLIYGLLKIRDGSIPNPLYEKYKDALFHEFDQKNLLNQYMTEKGLSVNRLAFLKENSELYAKVHSQVLSNSMIEVFASKELCPQIHLSGTETGVNTTLIRESEELMQVNGVNYRCRVSNEWFEMIGERHNTNNFDRIKKYLYEAIIFYNAFKVYFFPAERSALNLVGKELVQEKALERDEISRRLLAGENLGRLVKSFNGTFMPRYPLAISDYIYLINDSLYIKKNESEYGTLAIEIEKNLMHGKVIIDEYGELLFKPNKRRKPLPLHLGSSLVKSLAGLVIYFRHLARKNDVIIIDEPELNLHPDNQRRLAKILAKVANQGFKIILSTHSDYIIKEFNNLIMLTKESSAKVKKALLKQYRYDAEMILDIDTVGTYFFNDNTIHSVPVTEKGFGVETINEEIDDLEDATHNIYFQLFEIVR
jgi:energy-coupling factor transporter ATP-binding protein EcfA2